MILDLESATRKTARFWVSCKSSYILRFQPAILDRPFWIFEIWLIIRNSQSKKPQDTEFHASQIEFCNFDLPYWIRHLRFWKISEYDFIFALLAWFLNSFRKDECYEKITLKIMHIFKILSFLTIFERAYTRRGDFKRFGDFFRVGSNLNYQNKPLINFLLWFLWM